MTRISGFVIPINKIVCYGEPKFLEGVAEEAGFVAGMWVAAGSKEGKVIRGQPGLGAKGFVSYASSYVAVESSTDKNQSQRPRGLRLPFGNGAIISVLFGANFGLSVPVAPGVAIFESCALAGWTDGTLLPGKPCAGGVTVSIPFTKSTDEMPTNFTIPAGIKVADARIKVTTNVSGGTISAGILSTEAGGDADGFLKTASAAAAGTIQPIVLDTTAANLTKGALLGTVIKSADSTAVYASIAIKFTGDGTAKTVSYTTSNHAIAGYIELDIIGLEIIGKAMFPLPADDEQQWMVAEASV